MYTYEQGFGIHRDICVLSCIYGSGVAAHRIASRYSWVSGCVHAHRHWNISLGPLLEWESAGWGVLVYTLLLPVYRVNLLFLDIELHLEIDVRTQ